MVRRGTASSGARRASRGADVVLVAVRELRLLLGLLLILFITAETWRYIGRLAAPRLVLLVVVGFGAALLVVVIGLRRALGKTLGRVDLRRATTRVAGEVVAFGLIIFVAFVLVGVITVDAQLVAEWTGVEGGVLASLEVGRPPLVVTRGLLQVAALLASLGALVFAVEAVIDPGTRETLLRDLVEPSPRRHRSGDR